jgi:pilus assembly protein Flp/PilA
MSPIRGKLERSNSSSEAFNRASEPRIPDHKEVSDSMTSLYWKLRGLFVRQEGQGMVEYALILVLVSIVVIIILMTMGQQIKNVFSNVVAALSA